jgi:hypothetical protein
VRRRPSSANKPIDVDASTDLVPDTPPDPQKPASRQGRRSGKAQSAEAGQTEHRVVDLPCPTISCANGKVKGDACECEPHFAVKAGKNAWRCVRSTVDPKPEKPIVSEPKISCAGGTVKNGACTCARTHKPVKAGKDAWRCTKVVVVDPPKERGSANKVELKTAPKKTAAPKLGNASKAKGGKGKGKTAKEGTARVPCVSRRRLRERKRASSSGGAFPVNLLVD